MSSKPANDRPLWTFIHPNFGIFSSPNSSTPPQLPIAGAFSELDVDRPHDLRYSDNRYPFLPFTPVYPKLTEPPFDVLNTFGHDVKVERTPTGKWAVAKRTVDRWSRLEERLRFVAHHLEQWRPLVALDALPIPWPSKFGYRSAHNSPGAAKKAGRKSRSIFILSMGYCSFLMSRRMGVTVDGRHQWEQDMDINETLKFDPDLIAVFKSSELLCRTNYARAGVVITPSFQHLDIIQPLLNFDVPVYFYWGAQSIHESRFDRAWCIEEKYQPRTFSGPTVYRYQALEPSPLEIPQPLFSQIPSHSPPPSTPTSKAPVPRYSGDPYADMSDDDEESYGPIVEEEVKPFGPFPKVEPGSGQRANEKVWDYLRRRAEANADAWQTSDSAKLKQMQDWYKHSQKGLAPGPRSHTAMYVWLVDEETGHEMRTHKFKQDTDDWYSFFRRFDPAKNQWDLMTRPIPDDVPDFMQILESRRSSSNHLSSHVDPEPSSSSVSSVSEAMTSEISSVSTVSELGPSESSDDTTELSTIPDLSSLPESDLAAPMDVGSPEPMDTRHHEEFLYTPWACDQDLQSNIYSVFGFAPLNTTGNVLPQVKIRWQDAARMVGNRHESTVAIDTQGPIINFFHNLTTQPPTITALNIAEQDIAANAAFPLQEHGALGFGVSIFNVDDVRYYRLVPTAVDIPQPAWQLIVTDPVGVLICLREDLGGSVFRAARFLFSRGISFSTRITSFVSPPATAPYTDYILGWRPANHAPTVGEYAFCQDLRDRFLMRPYARAAFLRGGIIWRLAVESTERLSDAECSAVDGPSVDIAHYDCISSNAHGEMYDDSLTEQEKDLICGVYKVATSKLASVYVYFLG